MTAKMRLTILLLALLQVANAGGKNSKKYAGKTDPVKEEKYFDEENAGEKSSQKNTDKTDSLEEEKHFDEDSKSDGKFIDVKFKNKTFRNVLNDSFDETDCSKQNANVSFDDIFTDDIDLNEQEYFTSDTWRPKEEAKYQLSDPFDGEDEIDESVFFENLECHQKSVRHIKENEEDVKKLLEDEELRMFGVVGDDGELVKNHYEFDDVGFRMLIRNVQHIDDSEGQFTSTFMVDLSWFDFPAFQKIWQSKNAPEGDYESVDYGITRGGVMLNGMNLETFQKQVVGDKRTIRITVDLLQNGIDTEAVFKPSLPKISFRKLKDTNH